MKNLIVLFLILFAQMSGFAQTNADAVQVLTQRRTDFLNAPRFRSSFFWLQSPTGKLRPYVRDDSYNGSDALVPTKFSAKYKPLYLDSTIVGGGGTVVEADPLVPAHVKAITTTNISSWNAKISSEADPTVPAAAKSITYGDIATWNNNVSDTRIATIATARQTSAGTGIKSFNITDAGRQGIFQVDINDGTTADDGAVTIISADGKRFKRVFSPESVSPSWWGADIGGNVDGTTALQTAINYASARGFAVRFGGNIRITTLTLPDNAVLIGSNNATITQVRSTSTAARAITLGNNNKLSGFTLVCDPHSTGVLNDNGGVFASGKRNITVSNMYVKNHALFGVYITNCRQVTIENSRFWTNFAHSSATTTSGDWANSSDIFVYNNSTNGSEDVLISGNRCHSPMTSQGIWVNGNGFDRQIQITNNNCTTRNEDGTLWTDTRYYLTAGAGMNRRHGIMSSYGSTASSGGFVISGNICGQTIVTGIYVSGSGAGKGALIQGNYCFSNGYDTVLDASLAGGISLTGGSGGDVASNNYIIDFKGSSDVNGAINIQRNANDNAFHAPTCYNNFIINSGSNGYRVNNSADKVTISGGAVIGSTRSDVFYENNIGTSNVSGWFQVQNVRFERTNNSFPSLHFDAWTGAKKLEVRDCLFYGTGDWTNSATNTAVRIWQNNYAVVFQNNTIEGFQRGVSFNAPPAGRLVDKVLTGNTFKNVQYCWIASPVSSNTALLVGRNSYIDVENVSQTWGYRSYYEGEWLKNTGVATVRADWTNNAAPTDGTWLLGDVLNNSASTPSPSFWRCTVAGTPGVWAAVISNSSDATLLNRTNHTGTQLASTISDFAAIVTANSTVAGKATLATANTWPLAQTFTASPVFNSKLTTDFTNTASGTTGNQTINKPTGTVNFAATSTSVTVTNSLVTANSLVFCVIRTNDANAIIKNVTPAAGSFVIRTTAAVAAETSVGFFVIN